MTTLFATFRKVKPSNPKSGNGDTFRTMFHRIALCISISLLVAACGSDKVEEPMFEESGDEQSVLGSSPESPAADAGEVVADIPRPSIPVGPGAALPDADESPPAFLDDRIIAADLWGAELAILSAGMGFDGVIGLPNTDIETVRAAGGSYYLPACADNPIISGATAAGINAFYRGTPDDSADFDDGLPVVFTWPVLGSTVHPCLLYTSPSPRD